jgi:hypothetical protein
VLLGDREDYGLIEEGREDAGAVEQMLRESDGIAPLEWFRRKTELDPEMYQADEGDWPDSGDEMGIITHLDILTRKPKKEVFIGLFSVKAPWEVFAHLSWGGWNDCPFPAEHCAIHRYWASKCGAEVASVTHDVVQCLVARPPRDRDAALQLAREQYIYCTDIVDQGTETIISLAAGLLDAKVWYFWWD